MKTALFAADMRTPKARARSRSAIFTFVAITFGWTWSLWAISTFMMPLAPEMGKAVFIAAGFGPSLGAVLVVMMFDRASGLHNWLRRCLTWRFALGWYAAAFLAAPLAMLAALGIHGALGGSIPAFAITGPAYHTIAQFGLVLIIGGPLGEEFGWRGFLLPGLAATTDWRWASLIVGALWGIWHLPLFYIAGTGQSQMPMALFMASAVALSVVFARLSVNTDFSVLPALLLHWSINAWSLVIPMIPNGGSVRPYALVTGIVFLMSAMVFLKPGPKHRTLAEQALRNLT